jgi:predicted Zn-dependent peptidase
MLLNTILGGGMSSRLFEEIREKRGMAYSVYSYLSSFSDAGALPIFAGTERERSNEALQIILAELDRFKTELVPKDELNSAREQVKGKILMSLESSDSYMMRLARSYLNFGRFQPVDEVIAGFDAVTEEDILQLAVKLLREEHLNIQIMGRMNELEFK